MTSDGSNCVSGLVVVGRFISNCWGANVLHSLVVSKNIIWQETTKVSIRYEQVNHTKFLYKQGNIIKMKITVGTSLLLNDIIVTKIVF